MSVVEAIPAQPLNGRAVVWAVADVVVAAFADEAGADGVGEGGHAAAPACAGANISAAGVLSLAGFGLNIEGWPIAASMRLQAVSK